MKTKIRGIYTTALTTLLLKQGITIVQPTQPIQERLNLPPLNLPEEVYIHDQLNKQGVVVQGERAEEMVKLFRDLLPEAVFRTVEGGLRLDELSGRKLSLWELQKLAHRYEIEFPCQVKRALDELRKALTPTIPGHHQLKTIDAVAVDMVEAELKNNPEKAQELSLKLKEKLIYEGYRPGDGFLIHHVKLSGPPIVIRCQIEKIEPGRLILKRKFSPGGEYDGLGLSKEEGDWGVIELEEESWGHWRRYFSSKGELKGEIYNINTPIEFYPGSARYIDLEVDVVLTGKEVRIIDEERIEKEARRGTISPILKDKALKIAQEVAKRLSGKRPQPLNL